MQKKYILLFGFFMSNNVVAQLPNDLARFTQTLKNLAAKLPAGIVPPLIPFFDKPAGKNIPMPDDITAPPGSTAQEADADQLPIITVPATGGNVTMSGFGGYVGVTVDSQVLLLGKTVPIQVPAGKYIWVEEDAVVTITPKGVVPPPLIPPGGKNIPVPPSGDVKLPGTIGTVNLPKDSKVTELPSGEVDITLSSDGSLTLPNKKIIKGPKGTTVKLDKNGLPTVTIPVSKNIVSITIPKNTKYSISSPAIVRRAGVSDRNVSPDEVLIASEDSTFTIIPQGIVSPPLVSLASTDRKPEDVFKTVGNVIQLKTPVIFNTVEAKKEAQAISGYITVYYAFNELSRVLNGKDLALTFNQFMEPTAMRSIKKRRIQVACKNYIANILTKSPYLVPEDLEPELKTPGFKLTFKQVRGIYNSLLSNLAGEIASTYVEDNYVNGAIVAQDTLRPSKTILIKLTTTFKNFVDRRKDDYAKEFNVSSKALSALIDQANYLQEYAHITDATTIEFDARHVLTELHKPDIFGIEEGYLGANLLDDRGLLKKEYINQVMPSGQWLHEGDITHLVRDPVVLKVVALPENVKDMITIFNDLNLLNLTQEQLTTASREIRNKEALNKTMLAELSEAEKDNIHIFIVNVGFYFLSNRPSDSRWVIIARYPNNEYIVVDAQDVDRTTKNIDLQIIQKAFAKS